MGSWQSQTHNWRNVQNHCILVCLEKNRSNGRNLVFVVIFLKSLNNICSALKHGLITHESWELVIKHGQGIFLWQIITIVSVCGNSKQINKWTNTDISFCSHTSPLSFYFIHFMCLFFWIFLSPFGITGEVYVFCREPKISRGLKKFFSETQLASILMVLKKWVNSHKAGCPTL